jgi:DNA-binding NarL/FixJ family response regulator
VSEGRLRLVIADDQTSVRDGLVALLSTLPDLEVVGSAGDGAAVLELVERQRPDAVLMDLRMPGVDGVEATERLARSHPDVAVVVLTTFADDDSVLSALRAGAAGYLTKDAGRADMARALHAAVAGQVTMAGPVQRTLLSAALRSRAAEPWPDGLTDREGQILVLIANGLSNREITERLFIGTATVKTHINRIFAKIGVGDRRGAIAYAVSRRLSTRGSPGAGPAT